MAGSGHVAGCTLHACNSARLFFVGFALYSVNSARLNELEITAVRLQRANKGFPAVLYRKQQSARYTIKKKLKCIVLAETADGGGCSG